MNTPIMFFLLLLSIQVRILFLYNNKNPIQVSDYKQKIQNSDGIFKNVNIVFLKQKKNK